MTDATLSPSATQWWVQVRGRAFGPYSIEQMARFMSEGRVRPDTMVADNPENGWIEARRVMSLRGLRTPTPANDIAEAANVSLAANPAAAKIITTRLEAYAFLGVNSHASFAAVKKTIDGLRQCWHPDLAVDERDRVHREIRMRQINAAWDLIREKEPLTGARH